MFHEKGKKFETQKRASAQSNMLIILELCDYNALPITLHNVEKSLSNKLNALSVIKGVPRYTHSPKAHLRCLSTSEAR